MNPRNQFNNRLSERYWDIPTDIPRATQYNTPIGTKYCDTLGFICHPQQYPNIHGGNYPVTNIESSLYNLDYYNVYDTSCQPLQQTHQQLSQELINQHFQNIKCVPTAKPWRNHTKLYKYNMPV